MTMINGTKLIAGKTKCKAGCGLVLNSFEVLKHDGHCFFCKCDCACRVDPAWSRMCEKGTKGCTIEHERKAQR